MTSPKRLSFPSPDGSPPDLSVDTPAAARLAQRDSLASRACALRREIVSIQNRCGSCNLWMTPLCPRERPGAEDGPLHDTPKCNKFVQDEDSKELVKNCQLELDRIVVDIAALSEQC